MGRVETVVHVVLVTLVLVAFALVTDLESSQRLERPVAVELGVSEVVTPDGTYLEYRYDLKGSRSSVLLRGWDDVEAYRSYLRSFAKLETYNGD